VCCCGWARKGRGSGHDCEHGHWGQLPHLCSMHETTRANFRLLAVRDLSVRCCTTNPRQETHLRNHPSMFISVSLLGVSWTWLVEASNSCPSAQSSRIIVFRVSYTIYHISPSRFHSSGFGRIDIFGHLIDGFGNRQCFLASYFVQRCAC